MKKKGEISIKAIVEMEGDKPVIRVKKRGEKIRRKFGFGKLEKGVLELSLEEALCLSDYQKVIFIFEGERREVEEIFPSFKDSLIFRRLVVLRDLIRRGYKAKSGPSPFDISCWKKGRKPEKDAPSIRIKAYSEDDLFSPKEIYELLRRCLFEKKELMLAVVDRDADISYYKVSFPEISGSYLEEACGKAKGIWTGEGVLVIEGSEDLERLGFGKKLGRFLHLSPEEAAYLKERGILESEVEIKDESSYNVYKDLRKRGTLPKSGYKFGGVFRVYCFENEEHSKFVVNPCSTDWKIRWCYLSSMVRTARGVRKKLVFALDLEGDIKYICLERIVP